MHVSTFENVHKAAVLLVVDEVAPRHFVGLAGEGEVVVPPVGLGYIELIDVPAAGTWAEVDELVMVDVLVAQLAKAMPACLVLNDAARVQRVAVGAHGAEGNGRTVVPHLADAAVVRAVGHHDDERLV